MPGFMKRNRFLFKIDYKKITGMSFFLALLYSFFLTGSSYRRTFRSREIQVHMGDLVRSIDTVFPSHIRTR